MESYNTKKPVNQPIPTSNFPYLNTFHMIGTAASHGCIRMYNKDVEELFPQVPIGTTVEIISGRTKKES